MSMIYYIFYVYTAQKKYFLFSGIYNTHLQAPISRMYAETTESFYEL